MDGVQLPQMPKPLGHCLTTRPLISETLHIPIKTFLQLLRKSALHLAKYD